MRYKYTFFFFVALVCYMPILEFYIPKTNFGSGIPDVGPFRLFAYLLVIVYIFEIPRNFINGWTFLLGIYAVVHLISVSWSPFYRYDLAFCQIWFNSVLIPYIVAVVAVSIFQSRERIHSYLKHLNIAAVALSIIGIVMLASGVRDVGGDIRAQATLGNPNMMAVYLVLAVPSVIYLMQSKMVSGKIGFSSLIIIIIGIVCTVSRKGVVNLFLGMVIYFFLRRQYRTLFLLLMAAFVGAGIMANIHFISQRFSSEQISQAAIGKYEMAKAGFRMFQDRPWLGWGWNGYYKNFGKYFPGIQTTRQYYDAHNEFITALANYGLFGFMIFMTVFLIPLRRGWSIVSRFPDASYFQTSMAIIAFSCVVPFMIECFTAGTLFFRPEMVSLFYAQAALAFAGHQKG